MNYQNDENISISNNSTKRQEGCLDQGKSGSSINVLLSHSPLARIKWPDNESKLSSVSSISFGSTVNSSATNPTNSTRMATPTTISNLDFNPSSSSTSSYGSSFTMSTRPSLSPSASRKNRPAESFDLPYQIKDDYQLDSSQQRQYNIEYQIAKVKERFGDIQIVVKNGTTSSGRDDTNDLREQRQRQKSNAANSSRFFPEEREKMSVLQRSNSLIIQSTHHTTTSTSLTPQMHHPPSASSLLKNANVCTIATTITNTTNNNNGLHDTTILRPILPNQGTPPGLTHILKMTNIPWEISTADVTSFFHEYGTIKDCVHIPIDRVSGKTKNEVYVEFDNLASLLDALARKHRGMIKSREVFLNRSSNEELLRVHFPKSRVAELGEAITAEEISSIATICRYYKIHFSRKCAERPFEHVISILKLLPWSQLSERAKDQCYELLKMTLDALFSHYAHPNNNIDKTLLSRLVNAGINYGQWSDEKKQQLEQLKESMIGMMMMSSDGNGTGMTGSGNSSSPISPFQMLSTIGILTTANTNNNNNTININSHSPTQSHQSQSGDGGIGGLAGSENSCVMEPLSGVSSLSSSSEQRKLTYEQLTEWNQVLIERIQELMTRIHDLEKQLLTIRCVGGGGEMKSTLRG